MGISINPHVKYALLTALFFCATPAFALSGLSMTAEKITHEEAMLTKAKIHLDLNGQGQAVVDAKSLEYGNMRLDEAHILLDLKANTTLLVKADSIASPSFAARNPTIDLDYRKTITQPTLSFKAEMKQADEKEWGTFHLNCFIPPKKQKEVWRCVDGLYTGEHANVSFTIDFTPQVGGLEADIQFNNAKFSDEAGLHAGEKLNGQIKLAAQMQRNRWNWRGKVLWKSGELFWQPFYFGQSGHEFNIAGRYEAPYLAIDEAELKVKGVGNMSAKAEVNLQTKAVKAMHVMADEVDFAGLYQMFIQPMAAQSVFGHLKVSGTADWQFKYDEGQPKSFELNLANADIVDEAGKFGFTNLNAHIPWDYNDAKTMHLAYSAGHLLKIPLGTTYLKSEVNRYSVTAPTLNLPVLDGALQFDDVSAAWVGGKMVWHLGMALKPISMKAFSQAVGWPEMKGQIDGKIPLITYANEQLFMDGTMQFNMFNGMIAMSDLRIDRPIGVAPKLAANLTMRAIDLGDLTRTFNFGSIEGKLEGDVKDLRLENWKPVYMNAMIQTADGNHVKKVSQRAVENITALGGEGTAAALQRTFLRFFKEFNYEKIGLSCELRQDICKMGGVEPTPTGFIIVKGKNIPAVSVNGFTQYVSWKDLMARMQRITDTNTKAVVK